MNKMPAWYYKKELHPFLMGLIGDTKLVDKWWTSKNKAFDNKTPYDYLEIDPKEVANYVLDMYQH
jgi:hypothetical protein